MRQRIPSILRPLIAFTLLATALVGVSASAVAQDAGDAARLEIHHRLCPEDYAGVNYYDDCHGTPGPAGTAFTLSGPESYSLSTDASGNVVVNPAAGTYTVTGGIPGEFARSFIFCASLEDLGTEYGNYTVLGGGVRGPDDPIGIEITFNAGDAVVCDWYNIPENLSGLTPTPVPTEPTPDDGTLTIYKATCPPGYLPGDDIFEDCFANATADVQFVIGTTATDNVGAATTGPDGFVVFELAPYLIGPQSTITFGETTVDTGDINPVVVCTDGAGEAVEIVDETQLQYEGSGPVYAVTIAPEADDQIRCDWYNLPPEADVTPSPTLAPLPTATTMPTPDPDARPAAIREGNCGPDGLGDVVIELTGLSEPEGDPVGQESAILAPSSFTVVDVSLDQLVSEDYAVTVGEPRAEATGDPVVCGEIGGVFNDNGNLVIGLSEQNQSDQTGIAFFSSSDTNSDQTEISVFIAEGLAAHEPEILESEQG